MLGHSGMVNQDQIQDCLDRGWIVVVPNHRLCPQVDISALVDDIRDLLRWIQNGRLDEILAEQSKSSVQCDLERIIAFGTSAGAHLSLCLVRARIASNTTFANLMTRASVWRNPLQRSWTFMAHVISHNHFGHRRSPRCMKRSLNFQKSSSTESTMRHPSLQEGVSRSKAKQLEGPISKIPESRSQ